MGGLFNSFELIELRILDIMSLILNKGENIHDKKKRENILLTINNLPKKVNFISQMVENIFLKR